jgi:transposase
MEDTMRRQKHPIKLSESERTELVTIVTTGRQKTRVLRRAQMLLWSDEGKPDTEIAELLKLAPLTVATTRLRWIEKHTLEDEPRRGRGKKLDGKQEAFLVALACSDAPNGLEKWTMRLLADKLVELEVVHGVVSDETVRRTLKKTT